MHRILVGLCKTIIVLLGIIFILSYTCDNSVETFKARKSKPAPAPKPAPKSTSKTNIVINTGGPSYRGGSGFNASSSLTEVIATNVAVAVIKNKKLILN